MEQISPNEAFPVALTGQQKNYIITTLEIDFDTNSDIWNEPEYANSLNELYKKLTGQDHPKWIKKHSK